MIKPWHKKRLEVLRERFGQQPFSYKDALTFLKKERRSNPGQVKVVLSELRRSGFLIRETDSQDARKKVYSLRALSSLLPEGTLPTNMTSEEWNTFWFKVLDLLRYRKDPVFLPLLLYINKNCEQTKVQWGRIAKDPTSIKEAFNRILKTAIEDNPQVQDVFDLKEFARFVEKPGNRVLVGQFVELLATIPLDCVDPLVLRQAYEQILGLAAFPNQSGYYSIPQVIPQLLVGIIDPQSGDTVYDAWMGLGSVLTECYLFAQRREVGKEKTSPLILFGREDRPIFQTLARRNLLFNGIENVQLLKGDDRPHQQFGNDEGTNLYDLILSFPPFHFGLPSRISSDWKEIRFMLSLTGKRAGLVLESVCLNRGGREKDIRAEVIKGDYLEAVFQLPKNLSPEIRIPLTILVFNKTKSPERKNSVLFIDTNAIYEACSETSRFNPIGKKQIRRILSTYREYREHEGFSRVVSIQEVERNEYNLSVPLYVGPSKKGGNVDVSKLWQTLKAQDIAIKKEMGEIEIALKTLGY
jgi:type I restriction enzyme M protein